MLLLSVLCSRAFGAFQHGGREDAARPVPLVRDQAGDKWGLAGSFKTSHRCNGLYPELCRGARHGRGWATGACNAALFKHKIG